MKEKAILLANKLIVEFDQHFHAYEIKEIANLFYLDTSTLINPVSFSIYNSLNHAESREFIRPHNFTFQ